MPVLFDSWMPIESHALNFSQQKFALLTKRFVHYIILHHQKLEFGKCSSNYQPVLEINSLLFINFLSYASSVN